MTFKRTTTSPKRAIAWNRHQADGKWAGVILIPINWSLASFPDVTTFFVSHWKHLANQILVGKRICLRADLPKRGWGVAVLQAKKPTSACAYSCILVRQAIRSTFSSPSQVTSSLLFKILLIAFQYPWMERGIVRVIKVSRRWISTKRQSNVGHVQGINYCRLHANFPRKTSIENVGSNKKSHKVSESNLERS